MTTFVEQQPASPAGPTPERMLRSLSIAANLLPTEVIAQRQGRRARRAVLSGLVAFTVLLGGWYGVTVLQTAQTRDDLAGAEADVQRLLQHQRKYNDLVNAQADTRSINGQLGTLLASDLEWSKLFTDIRNAAPNGVRVTGVSAAILKENAAKATEGRMPTRAKEPTVGNVTITGVGPTKASVAGYVDALATIPGLGNPTLGSVNEQNGETQFSIRLDITDARLGGRYTKTDGKADSNGTETNGAGK